MSQIEVIVQNQDNREYDLLDSDDYYQLQGGMSNAVTVLKGDMPVVYHGDHSNLNALKEMAERLLEVQQPGLWQNPRDYQQQLIDTILEIDNSLEVAD